MVKTLIIGFCLILSLLIWRQLNKEYKLPVDKEPDFTLEWNINRIRDLEFRCKQLGLSLDRSRGRDICVKYP